MAMGHRPVACSPPWPVWYSVSGSTLLTALGRGWCAHYCGFKHVYVDSINLNFALAECRETTSAPSRSPRYKSFTDCSVKVTHLCPADLLHFLFLLPPIPTYHSRAVHCTSVEVGHSSIALATVAGVLLRVRGPVRAPPLHEAAEEGAREALGHRLVPG